jgi:phytoene dehydrogenase-like protein
LDPVDAIVVGAGPNGLAAAIVLASAGLGVRVLEAKDRVGGGARTEALTLPGYFHDVCSAIHPMALASPFFRTLPLDKHGLAWIHPEAPLAHPLHDGTAVLLERDVQATSEAMGVDAAAYRRLFAPLARDADALFDDLLAPLRFPHNPLKMALFGLGALRSATGITRDAFEGVRARALFAGCAAHSVLPLERAGSAAFGLVLGGSGHAYGWPCARGGSQAIADALSAHLRSLGGEIETGREVRTLADLPAARAVLLDVAPRNLVAIAGDRLPERYAKRLLAYRHGPGVFKVDWALAGPIPWRAEGCARAGTVHVGGTLEEIAASESAVWRGEHPEKPFVLVAQQSRFDPTRAPSGKHTGWAYCHVPHGSTADMSERIEAQVERFAPGLRDLILARKTAGPSEVEAHNANCIGGDITGGVTDLGQLYARPVSWSDPYATPNPAIYLCSSSTPPGAGVHGMCGYHAARTVMRRVFGKRGL